MKLKGWKTAVGLAGVALCQVLPKVLPELQQIADALLPLFWTLAGAGAIHKVVRNEA